MLQFNQPSREESWSRFWEVIATISSSWREAEDGQPHRDELPQGLCD
jgi:hypothetical protein